MSKIVMIPIKKIIPDPNQPRKVFDAGELNNLMTSIQKEGVRVPLIVESNYDENKFLILDGERRYRACIAAKLEAIPAIVETGPLSFERRTQIRFNVQEQHANWNDIDKAKAIFDYKQTSKQTIQEIAEKLNLHLAKVHAYLSITELSDSAQALIAKNNIQFSYLTYLVRIVKSYLALSEKFSREEIEEKMIFKISNNIFRTIPDIQNFSKTLQVSDDIEIKLNFLNAPEMTYYSYLELLKMDSKEFVNKLHKLFQTLNFELERAKDKNYRLFDEQFAIFTEITNKMREFETLQAIEQNTDPVFDDFKS